MLSSKWMQSTLPSGIVTWLLREMTECILFQMNSSLKRKNRSPVKYRAITPAHHHLTGETASTSPSATTAMTDGSPTSMSSTAPSLKSIE